MSLEPGMMVVVRKTSTDKNYIPEGSQLILGEVCTIGKKTVGVKFFQDSGTEEECFRKMDCIHKIHPREIALCFCASLKNDLVHDLELRDSLETLPYRSPTWTKQELNYFADKYKKFLLK